MIISEWSLSFETRALPEERLRAIAHEMFQGRVGRNYWQNARQARLFWTGIGTAATMLYRILSRRSRL